MKKKICCISIVLFFIICILGSSQADIVSLPEMVSAESGAQSQRNARLLPVDSLQKMDDFHAVSAANGNSSGVTHGIRQAVCLFSAVIAMLFFGILSLEGRFYLPDKRIPVFLVVTFIHRTDGKKKSCFDF